MQLVRSGIFRDHGAKTLLRCDFDDANVIWSNDSGALRISRNEVRRAIGEASYRYVLSLNANELLRCLQVIPSDMLCEVVSGFESADRQTLAAKIAAMVCGIATPLPADEDEG